MTFMCYLMDIFQSFSYTISQQHLTLSLIFLPAAFFSFNFSHPFEIPPIRPFLLSFFYWPIFLFSHYILEFIKT